MNKLQLSLFVFLGLVCLTWGWEPGTQYVYKYVGRSIAGIKKLKQQNAIIELSSSVTVQSVDEYTILVQLTETRVRRHGYYLDDPYHIGENGQPEEIEGEEDAVADLEAVYAPFSIYHTKGSISSIKVGADEPLWVVNLKKSIAGQLQLDVTGVRADGAGYNKYAPKEGEKATFNVYEDSVTGDCSTTIEISRLPHAQVLSSNAFKVASFESVCGDKPVFQIIKTKDFNNCKTNPTWHSTTSDVYTCDFDKANCGDFIKRTAVYKYVACGDSLAQSTVVHANGYSDLAAQPFATKTDELTNAVVTKWALVKKESISYKFAISSYPREHKSLAYVFGDFQQVNQDGSPAKPNLAEALIRSPAPVEALQGSVLDGLYVVAEDLKNTNDAGQDNLDRLAVMSRVLAMLSLDELRDLWDDVKGKDFTTLTLFVDVVVQAGSNPSVLLIKELIESEQITGHTANFAMSALGYYVKTPTRELLKELVDLAKSDAVKSSKTLEQIALITVSDLLSAACGNRLSAAKRFTAAVLGDFCDRKDTIITKDFLPLLANELESSKSVFDRIVALAAIGSLSVEEIVPILLPVLRGNGQHDDTAERVRAILSLSRVVFTAPEKVHPILVSLAGNNGERNEVRMAALSLLLLSNAAEPLWKRFASNTWIEPSKQVVSFTNALITSIAKAPASTPLIAELARKANLVACLVKPAPFGLPYSFHDIQSSSLDEGIAVMMHTISIRDSDQQFPAYLSNSYFYQLGPLNREPFTVSMWNFNMADLWQNLFSKFYRGVSVKYDAMWSEKKGDKKGDIIKGIWEQLKAAAKPGDKRAGLMHINLLGSINRFINLESLEEEIPKFMAQTMKNNEAKKPMEVNMIKYRMLGEYNVRYATDLGLPVRYMFTLPLLSSIFGTVSTDGKLGLTSDLTTELSWKITGEVRVDIPFSGNHIATGVDVLVESHAPRLMTFNYHKGHLEFGWITDDKITDLFHYHVKPYTLTRSTVKPSMEGQDLWIISVTDKPIQREIDFGARKNLGVNVKLTEVSELPHGDKFAWDKYFAKWDINSISNMGFVPSELHYRKYAIRYDPNGTKAKTINTSYFYQYASKSAKTNLIYESGSAEARYPSEPEIVSYSPIAADFRPLALTMFKDIDSGNARLMTATMTSTHGDGTVEKFTSVVGMAMNSRYTKDCLDWHADYSTIKPNGDKKVNFAICYNAVRKWNQPPTYGFSKDVLEMTEEDNIGFGAYCEHKVKFTAKATRDEYAAEAAKNSDVGKQCLKDMAYGFQYGSPACTAARRMDHTYNNYEMVSEVENMSDEWLQWARGHTTWANEQIEGFITEHKFAQTNTPNRATWNIKHDLATGNYDMTFVRPHETVVAKNVRWGDKIKRISPLSHAFSKLYFPPLSATTNHILEGANLISAGVSEAKCYVGDNAVHTFDGAHYKYTVNECQHVLLTDCHRKSELAVLARKGDKGQKIVTVVYAKDTIEVDPIAYTVSINGYKTDYTKIEKGSHYEIRTPGAKSVKIVIFPLADGGVMVDIRSLLFFVKIQGSHVELSAPVHMRGRACGLCGDFNQEDKDDFKTADRCAVSSGDVMAASFILDGCYADKDIASRLKKETATCKSADQHFYTYLADYDVNASASKCTRYDGKCKSSYESKDTYQLYV